MSRGARDRDHDLERRTRLVQSAGVASVSVAVALVVLKIWAWTATGSIAMLGSLADSVLDLFASTMTLIAVRFALEPADPEHRFGHGKLEAIAGLAQSFVITLSAGYVGFRAITRLIEPEPIAAPLAGTVVMLVSLVFTVSLVLYQRFVVRRTGSIAISADALHYKADVLTNIVVLAAIAASSWFGWYRADPILGLLVVLVILASVRAIVLQSLDVLLIQAHEISDAVEAAVRDGFPQAQVIIHADPFGVVEATDEF